MKPQKNLLFLGCFLFLSLVASLSFSQAENINEDDDYIATPATSGFSRFLSERHWGEAYLESEYTRLDDHNIVTDTWIKEGLHLFKIGDNYFDAYVKGRLFFDRNSDYWNNRIESGIGVRYRPFEKIGLVIFSEFLYDHYTGREGDDKNTDDSWYLDFQGGLYYWQWGGKEAWQIEGMHLYFPFTGWREIYGEAIYYHHADKNFIANIELKEGITLARLDGFSFESYIDIEASTDMDGEFYNNYVMIGPGIRVKPFANLDLKVSFEYFWGKHYRGEPESSSDFFSDFVVTLAFWTSF